jgi:hypothetical protein
LLLACAGNNNDYANERNIEVPSTIVCPVTLDIMVHVLMTRSGHNFRRSAILGWLQNGSGACPLTRLPMALSDIIPNIALEDKIENWSWENSIPDPDELDMDQAEQIFIGFATLS